MYLGLKKLFLGSFVACSLVACGGGSSISTSSAGGGLVTSSAVSSDSSVLSSLTVSSVASSADSMSSSLGASSVLSSSNSVSSSSIASSESSSSTVIVADTVAPVINLVGSSRIELNQGGVYLEQGAMAIDAVDGEVLVTVSGMVDTTNVGEYTVTYRASDRAGNTASVSRVVSVMDALAPVITLVGEAAITLYVGDSYTEQGATAVDAVDGDLTAALATSGQVDTAVAGSYVITYSVTDLAGNEGSVTRTITVKQLDYGFQFVDQNLVLFEGEYEHRFELRFDTVESKDRTLSISIAADSTASEGVDFDLNSHSLVVPANSRTAYLTLVIKDDEEFEGAESVVLAFSSGDFQSETLVEINDASVMGESHANLSRSYSQPMAIVDGDNLVVGGSNAYEVYNLLSETTSVVSSFSPGIGSGYGDAITYLGRHYVFVSGKLYELNISTGYSIVSESPWFVKWTSELQVLGGELYVIAGQTDVENATNQVIIYNFDSGEWRLGAPLNHVRYGAATAAVEGKLYVFGGNYGWDTAEVFDPLTAIWTYLPENSLLGSFFDTATSSGKYVDVVVSELAGGANVLRFDTDSGNWASYTLSIPSRQYQDSFRFKGKTYFIGGNDNQGFSKSIVSFYIGDDIELYAK